MAVTKIYAIKTTPQFSLDYDKTDKESIIVKNKNDSLDSLNYVMRDKNGIVTELSHDYFDKMKAYIQVDGENVKFKTITTAINCSVESTYKEWNVIRKQNDSNSGNLQYCIVQNFGTDLDPMVANEIGVKFAEEYLSDYQCIVSTHINTGLVHNHIEFNATSFVTGKKYNDCLKSISDIRKLSDRLCKEYNLDVLEKTAEFNIKRYTDKDGNIRFFEPTERKNSISYNETRKAINEAASLEYKKSHVAELKQDIDKFIPFSNSYEDLLQQLKNISYQVKDKKKNGEWRKYISFSRPEWDKYVRDISIGEEYTREKLSARILENEKTATKSFEKVSEASEQIQDNTFKINELDLNYKYKKKKQTRDGAFEYEKIPRSDLEKIIIIDIKKSNSEIDAILSSSRKVEHQREQVIHSNSKRKQYLMDRINGNLKTLKFVESKELKNINQISLIVKSIYEKRNSIYAQMEATGDNLKKFEAAVNLINRYNEIKNRIETNQKNASYSEVDLEVEKELISEMESKLRDANLINKNEQHKFVEFYNKMKSDFYQLNELMEKLNEEIRQYDDCVFNIKMIDRDNDNLYKKDISSYYSMKNMQEKER